MNLKTNGLIVRSALFLALMLLFGCETLFPGKGAKPADLVESDAPQWVKTGDVAGYSDKQFIRARGISSPGLTENDALALARVNAQKQISEQILTHVKSEITSIQRQVARNDEVEAFEDVVISTEQETSELLAGATKVAEWYDSRSQTGYCYLVMNRLELSERLTQNAHDKRGEALGYLASGREAAEKGNLSAYLKNLLHARKALAVALSNHAKVAGIGATAELRSRLETLELGKHWNETVSEYHELVGTIQLIPVSGNEQVASLSGTLKEPIVVRAATYDEQPIVGFPMLARTSPDNEGKVTIIPQSDQTDIDGLFAISLREIESAGSHSNTLTVAFNFDAVEKTTDLKSPRCSVTYFFPTRDSTRIAVLIFETIDGVENPKSITAGLIKQSLTDLGFQVIRPDVDRSASEIANLSPRLLKELLGGQCDYAIVGTAESALSSQDTRFITYKTRMIVDALELESGKTIPFEVLMGQNTKGIDTRKRQAIQLSLTKAAQVLVGRNRNDVGQLDRKFIARFEWGADWEK